jgi:hypothetical protein
MRQQFLQSIADVIPGCPEEGQNNWRNDRIAASVGYSGITRYNPVPDKPNLPSDQRKEANIQIGLMKIGMPPTITGSQNATTFAAAFIEAGSQALESLKKGADPQEVLSFLTLDGAAAHAHLQRMAGDPLRKAVLDKLTEQWQKMATLTDRLKKMVQQQAQQKKQQQQKTQGAMTDAQIKQGKFLLDASIKSDTHQQKMKRENQRHAMDSAGARQRMAISDATAASDIHRSNLKAFSE